MAKKFQIEILLNFERFEENGKIGFEVIVNKSNHLTKDKFECPYCTETLDVKFSVLEEHLTETFYEGEHELEENILHDIDAAITNDGTSRCKEDSTINENPEILKETLLNELYDLDVSDFLTPESLETLDDDKDYYEIYNDENYDRRSVSTISISDSDETCSTTSLLNLKYQKEIEDAIQSMQIDTLDESSLINFIEENTIIPTTDFEPFEYTDDLIIESPISMSSEEINVQIDPDSTKQLSGEEFVVTPQTSVFHMCPCKRVYKVKKFFLKHMKQYHPDYSLDDCETLGQTSIETVPQTRDGRPIHKCSVCERVYWTRRSYRRHMVCCHPEEAKRLHLRAKTYRCQYCEKIYYTSELLNEHLLLHMNPNHYQCSYCQKSFVSHNNLKRHINAVHLHIKTFICEVCGVKFNQKYSLRLHHQELHGTDGRYICNECGKTYGTKEKLKYHIKWTHYGYGKTLCKFCGKTFLNNNYKRHLRDVHKEGNQLEYACRYCEKIFNRRAYRDIHECTHTGEKKFACKICDARFTDPGYRYAHMRRSHKLEFEKRKKRKVNNKASTENHSAANSN